MYVNFPSFFPLCSLASLTLKSFLDLDQIYEDMKNPEKANIKEGDVDVAGFGKHYCIPCARYFVSEESLTTHQGTKPHKRRLRLFEKEPDTYTGPAVIIDNGPKKPSSAAVDDPLALPSNTASSELDPSLVAALKKL